jgi:hypothetical protein
VHWPVREAGSEVFGSVEAAGQGCTSSMRQAAAAQGLHHGIVAAQAHGDKQAEKEMTVPEEADITPVLTDRLWATIP